MLLGIGYYVRWVVDFNRDSSNAFNSFLFNHVIALFDMRTTQIGKYKVEIYDAIEDLPMQRFHKYNKMLLVDAGIGSPKDAAYAMELGADAVLLNTAVSAAKDPVKMAMAMKLAIEAGRLGFEAGRIEEKDYAVASSPTTGMVTS